MSNKCIHHEKVLISLKKARSLTDKIIEMIEKENYCIDVMQQNLAAIGLLKSANQALLETHLSTCFKSALEAKNEEKKKKMIGEILKVTHLSNK